MRIQSLLNSPAELDQPLSVAMTSTSTSPEPMYSDNLSDGRELDSATSTYSESPKDNLGAPVFNGNGKFRPHEYQPGDKQLASEVVSKHKQFHVKAEGRIAQSTKHIRYTSDKRTLTSKTGLEALNGESFALFTGS